MRISSTVQNPIWDLPVAQGVNPAISQNTLRFCNEQVVHQKSALLTPVKRPPYVLPTTSFGVECIEMTRRWWCWSVRPSRVCWWRTVTASSMIWRVRIGIRQNKLWLCFSSKCIQELKYWCGKIYSVCWFYRKLKGPGGRPPQLRWRLQSYCNIADEGVRKSAESETHNSHERFSMKTFNLNMTWCNIGCAIASSEQNRNQMCA